MKGNLRGTESTGSNSIDQGDTKPKQSGRRLQLKVFWKWV